MTYMYKNIDQENFNILKARMKKITSLIRYFLNVHGFDETYRYADETLGFNFNLVKTEDQKIHGNISLLYEDILGKPTFRFGILKLMHLEGKRYCYKLSLVEGEPIEYFEQNIKVIVVDAVQRFQSISEEFMLGNGELNKE